jgi:hypothetical protein
MNEVNDSIDEFLKELEETLPKLVRSGDLVRLGIASSLSSLYEQRRRGVGIPYIKLGNKRIRYPRQAVLEHIRKGCYRTEN